MPNRPAEQLAQDVAATLVRWQHVVGDQERHGPRMIGDDLVAEALALERVGIVPKEVTHPGVDRGEQVRVVVGRDLLEDACETFQPHAGVDAAERQRHATVGSLVELHEHEVPDLEPARTCLAVVRRAFADPPTDALRGRSGSRLTDRMDRCPPSARSCCRPRCRHHPSVPSAPAADRSPRARCPTRRRRPYRSLPPAARPGCRGHGSGSPTRNGWLRA